MAEELLQPEAQIDGWHVSMNVGEMEEVRFKNKLYTTDSSFSETRRVKGSFLQGVLFPRYACTQLKLVHMRR